MGIEQTVVIVGGGYAGILCANRLRSSLGEDRAALTRVVVVNPTSEFQERIRLHEVAAGTRTSAAIPLAEMLHPDVEVTIGRVVRIDSPGRVAEVERAGEIRALHYDLLVYAVGSCADRRTPGVSEFALGLADPADAAVALQAIGASAPGSRVVVVGGGFTGVETASEVADQHPDLEVVLLSAELLVPHMRAAARRSIHRSLRRLGVDVRENARVDCITESAIVLDSGELVSFGVCMWTASFSVPDLARASGLTVDERGRLLVDEHLRSVDSQHILGAGDAVRLPESVGAHVRMGCAMALPLGGAAAATALAILRGEQPPTVSVGFLVQCVSLGRSRGYVQVVHADDSPTSLALGGRLGAFVKEAVCRMTVNSSRRERTEPGAFWAPKGPKPRPSGATPAQWAP
ncbi:NAD(P)/FAD-dependent oxidoreductase [Mycetocola zhadangensis]|uniref:NAD(P)/FAD-dependent oxidoreductase n=1 Tax=Mycetocola zhadangensis TaxID=1164595 RepID=UPI0015FF9738|nr:FAD-dependent oxidoreductase [Mycetocola zhadangensis]